MRGPPDRENLGQESVLAVSLLDQVHGHAPPSAQRREHPEVRRGLDAHGDAAAQTVARARRLGRAAVVGEQAACDRAADGERGQAGRQDDVARGRGEGARPGEDGEDYEP